MATTALFRRRPIASLASVAFAVALAVTVAYYAGLVPGVPKTLPTFVDLLRLTVGLFALAALAWVVSFVVQRPESTSGE